MSSDSSHTFLTYPYSLDTSALVFDAFQSGRAKDSVGTVQQFLRNTAIFRSSFFWFPPYHGCILSFASFFAFGHATRCVSFLFLFEKANQQERPLGRIPIPIVRTEPSCFRVPFQSTKWLINLAHCLVFQQTASMSSSPCRYAKPIPPRLVFAHGVRNDPVEFFVFWTFIPAFLHHGSGGDGWAGGEGGWVGGYDKHTRSTAADQPALLPDYKITWFWGGGWGGHDFHL